ncbi:PRC-barrel domain containing protein [Arthrobacter deserti]|uniref:PRC-barrel domain containing protein n=1 Tax=Arthrobacter deserti TaxID=1742687 RepID=A0ABX1JNY9_9MICC|nr:PRC-barrel domain containing protein [Arthrobacter deserti]
MTQDETAHELQDATMWDSAGNRLGLVGEVHRDNASGQLAWATVALGLMETRERFVPLAGARLEGTDVYVAYDHDTIRDSPAVGGEPGAPLTIEEEAELNSYYGLA